MVSLVVNEWLYYIKDKSNEVVSEYSKIAKYREREKKKKGTKKLNEIMFHIIAYKERVTHQ